MIRDDYNATEGIEHLRAAVRMFDCNNESFNSEFTLAELLKIYAAYKLSGWDITPDEWADQQVSEALLGIIPQWNSDGPIYPEDRWSRALVIPPRRADVFVPPGDR